MLREKVGCKSNKVENTVEQMMVKRFAESIGDLNSIYVDSEVGKRSKYGRNVAPPTFPQVFDYGQIPDFIYQKMV